MKSRKHHKETVRVLLAVALAVLVAPPAYAATFAIDASYEDDRADARALELLERIHQLPDILEYAPPAPWYEEELLEEGPGYDFIPIDHNAEIMSSAPMAQTGTAKVIALAIEFTDVKHRTSHPISSVQNLITGSNSMKTYYEEVSYGQLTVDGTAVGWYEADNDMAYYGKPEGWGRDSRHFHELVAEAVLAANPYVDFSDYDTNGDRIIDAVAMVHAGQDEAAGGGANAIWSKQATYPGTLRVDGVYLGHYLTVSEYSPMGVYSHEFGHMLGLPDLYDTDYSSFGAGVWDIMASGAWNRWGNRPSHFSAWCKMYLGWVTPTTISSYVEGRQLKHMTGDEPEILKLPTPNSKEYFLLENRYRVSYDQYLPASGLLIWHIDQDVISNNLWRNTVNNNEAHKGVDLEEHSATQHLDTRGGGGGNDGDATDVWKNSLLGFSNVSTPSSNLYDDTDTRIKVFNISGSGSVMTIDIDFGGESLLPFLDTLSPIREALPGEMMVYNITVGTRSATGDTVDIEVMGEHASWAQISHRSVILGARGHTTVRLEVTPPVGTTKGVQGEVIVHAVSRNAQEMSADLQTITIVKQLHLLEADPPSRTVNVVPGTPKHLDVKLTNSGNGLENITLSLDSNRSYWGRLSIRKFSLDVLDSRTVQVTFEVPQGVLAGETEVFDLVLFSEVEGGGFEGDEKSSLMPTLHIPITMVVSDVISLRWGSIQPSSLLPGESVDYELTVYNEGNHEASILIGYQAPPGWVVNLEDGDSAIIPAFQAVTVNATITASGNALAGSLVFINLSAAEGMEFFYAKIPVTVVQLYMLELTGQDAKFTDPSQRVSYNLTVTNLGNGEDSIDILVRSNGGLWTVSADENYVTLGVGATDRRLDFHLFVTPPETADAFEEKEFTVELTSENGEVTATYTVGCTVNPISSFEVETEVGVDNIDPANQNAKATFWITVRNKGNLDDLFHMGLLELPEGWVPIFESQLLAVPAGKTKTVGLDLYPTSSDKPVLADTFSFRLHVASELGHGMPVEETFEVHVKAIRRHDVTTFESQYSAVSGSELTFRVLVTNFGNVHETVTLRVVGEIGRYSVENAELILAPFGQRVVNVTVHIQSAQESTSLSVQVVATTTDGKNQEYAPITIAVEGRSGIQQPVAIGAIVLAALLAIPCVVVVGRLRRR